MKKLCILLATIAPAHAENADPTRPPTAWLAPADVAVASGGGEGEPAGLRLQSVLIPQRGGKPVAVIGGRTVALGGRIDGATLIRLTEREAVLQGADGVTHLYLTPGVEKQLVVTPVAAGKRETVRQLKGSP